ncbi:MAG: nucleotidyl transferase AbiEii/AbiGii toxin family protein [Deltaproteobacteria bacterium]|nr:nucleotidyl transferase AbiEii/AbiGii toxin family protein [Deltaproteobacteria bacterium]
MITDIYFKQAELLLRIIPLIDREDVFALKGGTAINFFVCDLPRISIDIDLVYLPLEERELSLQAISDTLLRVGRNIESRIPGTKVHPRKTRDSDLLSGLFVRRDELMVKIEPNLIMRGSVYAPSRMSICPKARELFEVSLECRTLSVDEIYAGKICAALDRQHPRDLFDIMILLKHGSFSGAMRKAFIVYLISHDRPMVEILNPNLADIRPVFESEFQGMTLDEVTCEELEQTREMLVSLIANNLTESEKKFIVSVKEGAPQWNLIDIKGVEKLPAVRWKLMNIGRMDSSKHKKAISKLRDYLGV